MVKGAQAGQMRSSWVKWGQLSSGVNLSILGESNMMRNAGSSWVMLGEAVVGKVFTFITLMLLLYYAILKVGSKSKSCDSIFFSSVLPLY